MVAGLLLAFVGYVLVYAGIKGIHPWAPIVEAFGGKAPPPPGGEPVGGGGPSPSTDVLHGGGQYETGGTAPLRIILGALNAIPGWTLGDVCATSGHVEGSEHYACNAADISGDAKTLDRVRRYLVGAGKTHLLPIHCVIGPNPNCALGSIWSREAGFKPHCFTGESSHQSHVHVSAWPSVNGGC